MNGALKKAVRRMSCAEAVISGIIPVVFLLENTQHGVIDRALKA